MKTVKQEITVYHKRFAHLAPNGILKFKISGKKQAAQLRAAMRELGVNIHSEEKNK